MKPVKVDDELHQAIREHSAFLGCTGGDLIERALLANKAFKKQYDEVKSR